MKEARRLVGTTPDTSDAMGVGRLLVLLPALFVGMSCVGEPRQTDQSPPPTTAAAAVAESPAAPSLATTAVTDPIELRLEFTEDSWVEAVADGGDPVSELHIAGEEMVVNAQREIVLKVGNVGAVRATVNGQPYALPGKTGDVLRDHVIRAPAAP